MAVDKRKEVVCAVQKPAPIDIDDPAAFSTRSVWRVRLEPGSSTHRSAWNHLFLPQESSPGAVADYRIGYVAVLTGPEIHRVLHPLSGATTQHYDPDACQLDHVIQDRFFVRWNRAYRCRPCVNAGRIPVCQDKRLVLKNSPAPGAGGSVSLRRHAWRLTADQPGTVEQCSALPTLINVGSSLPAKPQKSWQNFEVQCAPASIWLRQHTVG
ncbi:hypothetical protein [Mesorhizobium sp. NBIMC_P2-C4]|uniref:hypothetical protein n=1 Tax=Mesorhizobium sp. NBIMC_P2-C4 TaxID=1380604 RepID=UPI001FCC36CA|nr:hypothetical protein [Mesorhizobium sp. NBIMC_P2-C4]